MNTEIVKVTHNGKWAIKGEPDIEIECYVTNNKRRLMSLKGTARAMGLKGQGSNAITDNLGSKTLLPYLTSELLNWVMRVKNGEIEKVKIGGGREIVPLEGELFVDICNAYIKAERDGAFKKPSAIIYVSIASNLSKIVSALAKTGVVAVIDEVTGYQYEREKDELQQLLELYVRKEYAPWTKTFSDEYYTEIHRLRGWEYKGKPKNQFIGKLTNRLIYDVLPDNVFSEIKDRNPKIKKGNKTYRKHRHHQFLTEDVGMPHLVKHLIAVITLMKACDKWEDFEALFSRLFYQDKEESYPVGK